MQLAQSRRQRERLSRRNEMLKAATALFAEKGYARTTLDEIAHRAEFGKGTIYNYFTGGKQEILKSILDDMYDDLLAMTTTAFSQDRLAAEPIRSLFRDYVENVFTYYSERRDVFLILLKEAYRMLFADEKVMSEYFATQRNRLMSAIVRPIEYGIRTGQLKDMPPLAVAHLLLGNIKGAQMHTCLTTRTNADDGDSPTPADQADFLTSLLFDGLLADAPRSSNGAA